MTLSFFAHVFTFRLLCHWWLLSFYRYCCHVTESFNWNQSWRSGSTTYGIPIHNHACTVAITDFSVCSEFEIHFPLQCTCPTMIHSVINNLHYWCHCSPPLRSRWMYRLRRSSLLKVRGIMFLCAPEIFLIPNYNQIYISHRCWWAYKASRKQLRWEQEHIEQVKPAREHVSITMCLAAGIPGFTVQEGGNRTDMYVFGGVWRTVGRVSIA